MEILDGSVISEIIFKRYAQKPGGWSYTISPAKSHGFYDATVASQEESWQLKLDTIFKPAPLVIGLKSEVDLQSYNVSLPLSFGYRRMNPDAAEKVGGWGAEAPGIGKLFASLTPVVPEPGRSYAHGPFVLTRGARPIHEPLQARLDERLSSEMLRLMKNRYPGYG